MFIALTIAMQRLADTQQAVLLLDQATIMENDASANGASPSLRLTLPANEPSSLPHIGKLHDPQIKVEIVGRDSRGNAFSLQIIPRPEKRAQEETGERPIDVTSASAG